MKLETKYLVNMPNRLVRLGIYINFGVWDIYHTYPNTAYPDVWYFLIVLSWKNSRGGPTKIWYQSMKLFSVRLSYVSLYKLFMVEVFKIITTNGYEAFLKVSHNKTDAFTLCIKIITIFILQLHSFSLLYYYHWLI